MIMEFTFYPYERSNVEKVEERWGTYKLVSRSKRILFIGRGNIKKHLMKHLPDGEEPAEGVEYFSVEYYETGEEAYEAWKDAIKDYKKKFGKYPKYNKPLD